MHVFVDNFKAKRNVYSIVFFLPFGSGLALTDSSRLLTSSSTNPQSSDHTDDPADIQY